MQYAEDDKKEEIEKEVYSYYLSRALSLLVLATNKIKDVVQIKQTFQTFTIASPLSATEKTSQSDAGFKNLMEGLSCNALILKLAVPTEKISSNNEYQIIVRAIANQYIEYSKGLVERLDIYGSKLLESAVAARRKVLVSIKEGLNEIDKNEITDSEIYKTKENGCYIATCVYGSYDCPQVWTLRRFRDSTLDKTWYGKIFINTYYAVSLIIVKWFGKKTWFRNFWKTKLDKMVITLNDRGVADTYYKDKY